MSARILYATQTEARQKRQDLLFTPRWTSGTSQIELAALGVPGGMSCQLLNGVPWRGTDRSLPRWGNGKPYKIFRFPKQPKYTQQK